MNEQYFLWSAVTMNLLTAAVLVSGGCIRRYQLYSYGYTQLYSKHLSRLFRFKLSLWVLLIVVDSVLFVNTFIRALGSDEGEEIRETPLFDHLDSSPQRLKY